MGTARIASNEAYEKARAKAILSSRLAFAAYVLYFLADCIVATCLPFYIPRQSVPFPFDVFWTPIGLLVVLMLPFFAVGRFVTRNARARGPRDGAILTFDLGKRDFNKWEKRGKRKYLVRSHQRVLAAYDVLQDVPHYQEWRQKVVSAFEENRRTILDL
ncbi:MAG: hypothetical protein WBS54_01680 [Acidobacteriota bacterium]